MAAVISGNGLGLFNTQQGNSSPLLLGSRHEGRRVNVATGNLVLQSLDEQMVWRGLTLSHLRTYNSAGSVAQVGSDGWMTGFERRVELISGTFNAAGSVMRRHAGDGGWQDFLYSSTNVYISKEGDDAHDRLVWTAATSTAPESWTWTEGSSRMQERYASHADAVLAGRLDQIRDSKSGATWTVAYAGHQISSLHAGDAATSDALLFSYDGAGRLSGVSTRENGAVLNQARYEYDVAGRLAAVVIDLSPHATTEPDDVWDATAAANDGRLYRTEYRYVDAASLLIAEVRASDGTVSRYTYDASGRVRTVTQGLGQTLTFSYAAGSTDVSDASGRTWTYIHVEAGRLAAVHGPAVDGLRDVAAYTYDADGNIQRVLTTRGSQTLARSDYAHSRNGNLLWEWHAADPAQGTAARAIKRSYSNYNQVVVETVYTGLDPDSAGSAVADGGLVTYYAYDSNNRIRYTVNPAGEVQEFVYNSSGNGAGQLAATRQYLGRSYSFTPTDTKQSPTASDLSNWVSAGGEKASSTLTSYLYDAWGRLSRAKTYAAVKADGTGLDDDAVETIEYQYNAQGRLLQERVQRSSTSVANDGRDSEQITTYAYDGSGRLLSQALEEQVGTAARRTLRSTTVAYVDSASTVRTVLEGGSSVGDGIASNDLLRIEVRDAAGQVVSSTESAASGGVAHGTRNYYDETGRLRATQDVGGGVTYLFYDTRGDLVGEVDATGALTEFVRDGLGRVVETRDYATRLDTSSWLLADVVQPNTVAEVRPGWAVDFSSLPVPQLDSSVVTVGSTGGPVHHENGALTFRVTEGTQSATQAVVVKDRHPLSESASYRAEVTTGASTVDTYLLFAVENGQSGSALQRASAYFRSGTLYRYQNRDGVASSSALATLKLSTTYIVEAEIREGSIDFRVYEKGQDRGSGFQFSEVANPSEWSEARIAVHGLVRPGATSANTLYLDNFEQIDAVRRAQQTYDGQGRVLTRTDAAGSVTTFSYDGAGRLVSERQTDAVGTAATARLTRYFHDAAGRQIARLDPEGYLAEFAYDRAGRLVRTTAYATATLAASRESGTLDALRPASSAQDQTTRTFHDGQGNVIGQLDAEGYFSEGIFDQARNERATRRYALQLTGLTGTESFSELRTKAQAGRHVETRRTFNAAGQPAVEVDGDGTVTRYFYDIQGRLLKTERAQGTIEQRDGVRRLDVFGNIVAELPGEGAAKLTAGMTEAQVDALYAQYGVRHSYDVLGRRIETVDAAGNKIWYFHDASGRLTHTVRGVHDAGGVANAEGEVTETRYTAFGETRETLTYSGRIFIAVPGNRDSVSSAISTLQYVATRDNRTQLEYDRAGRLTGRLDALGHRTSWVYDAFGQMTDQIVRVDSAPSITTRFAYDLRGQRLSQTDDLGGLSRTQSWTHDAFGRAVTYVDGRQVTTTTGYDRLGRQISVARSVSGRSESSSVTYDAWSRVLTQTDATGRAMTYIYTDAERKVVARSAEGVEVTTLRNRHGQVERELVGGVETVTEYDKNGQATAASRYTTEQVYDRETGTYYSETVRHGRTRRIYDARGLLQYSFDETDRKVEYQHDAAGRLTARIEDPDGLKITTRYKYDGQGRQVEVTDPNGVVSSMRYDAKGQLVETVQDTAAGGLNLKTSYSWDARGLQLSVTQGVGSANPLKVTYAYDNLGRRVSETVAPGTPGVPGVLNLTTSYRYDANDNVISRKDASGRTTWYTYDEANRIVFTVDGDGGVTRHWYDRAGRLTATRSYADKISPTVLGDTPTTAQLEQLVPNSNKTKDLQLYRIYDGDGRLALEIDGAGAVTEFRYDAAGRQVRSIRYANAKNISSIEWADWIAGTTTPAGVLYGFPADPTRDVDTFNVLDPVGRVRFQIAADGSVNEVRHDRAGRVTETWAYAHRLSSAERADVISGATTSEALSSTLAAHAGTARMQAQVYDAAGRERFGLTRDANGTYVVAERQYDAAGRVVTQVQYGTRISAATAPTESAVSAAVQASLSTDATVRATQVRTTRFSYDSAGCQRFATDASGALTETRYDAAGRVTETIAYGQRPTAGLTSLAQLTTWAGTQSAADLRKTSSQYDAAGRLEWRRDAAGKTEYFGYDGAGRVLKYTDRNGAVWDYGYDAAGRRTSETSPSVTVATVDAAGTVTTAVRRVITRMTYDGQGNVTSRTENADTTEARTTQYVYDNRGNQIRTIFPDAWHINEATGDLVATNTTTTIEVTYDTLNRAVVQKDVRGHYSYKVYDLLGQVAYEVDQEGYVTRSTYNAFGEKETLTRLATRINSGGVAGWTAGQPITMAQIKAAGVLTPSPANDRVITTAYDARGQAVQVRQSSVGYYNAAGTWTNGSPTTQFTYDAYGQLTKESVLLEGTAGQGTARWADTYRYYDALGRNTLTVDPEGYATSLKYNATGEVVEQVEHARALPEEDRSRGIAPGAADAITGTDRVTRWQYDAMGRKSTETVVRRYQRADGSAGVRSVHTVFTYDGEGRVTAVTGDAGTADATLTRTKYDAIGRVTSVQEPTRAVLAGSAEGSLAASTSIDLATSGLYEDVSPYTTLVYDAFGNAVQTRRFANGLKSGQTAPVADSERDQIEVTRYDRQGRAVMTRSAEGYLVYSSYDAADNVISQRYRLSGSDPSRDVTIRVTIGYDKAGRQTSSVQTRTSVATSAVHKESSEAVTYNAFGEIVTKSHEGFAGVLQYTYDAAGRLVSTNDGGVTRALGYNLAGHQVRESHKVYRGPGDVIDAVTWNTTDRLGRATVTRMPSRDGTAVIKQQFDRWGNVIEVLDARGFQTRYRYNDFNQVTRDERPLVEVLSEAGKSSWTRPVNEWFYDAFGRLLATKDANNKLRVNQYDAAGRLMKSKDATGSATLYAYDALGNQRMTQDALGHIKFKAYDRQNRITAIGDFMPDAAGAARGKTVLQGYRLNQNGDRVKVTDAMQYSAFYDYDGRNRLLRSETSMGVVMTYGHDVMGRKTLEQYARVTDNGVSGREIYDYETGLTFYEPGWTDDGKRTDREGEVVSVDQNTWDYDVFGRLVDHNNLSGRDHNYHHDAASGMLTGETAAGGEGASAEKLITYYDDGRIKEIREDDGKKWFRFEYDAAGNRTLEETYMRDGSNKLAHTVTRVVYDSHNRAQRVTQDDLSTGTSKRVFDLQYDYDAVGNRRRIVAKSGYGTNVAAVETVNEAPRVVAEAPNRAVRTGVTSEFTVLVSDVFRDREQNALTLTVAQADNTALPPWLTVQHDATTGELVFRAAPGAALAGTSVTVRLTARETGNTANAAYEDFTVQVVTNSAPTLQVGGTHEVKVKADQPWGMEIAAVDWFADSDIGDRLTLSVDNPAGMAWAAIDTSSGSVIRLTGTPVSGSYVMDVRATDEKGAYVVKRFSFAVAPNRAPDLVSVLPAREAILGREFNWTARLDSVFVDANGDALTVKASGAPAWMSFQHLHDQAVPELRLSGRVPADEVDGRVYTVTLTATDPDGLSRTTSFTITVRANRAPALVVPGGWSLPAMRVNDKLDLTIPIGTLFKDPEGDQILIDTLFPSGSTLAPWLKVSVDQTTRTIRFHGTPTDNAQAGNLSFQLRGRDPAGLSNTANLAISIGTDTAPARNSGVSLVDRTLSIGRSFSFVLPDGLFNDADAGDVLKLSASLAVQKQRTIEVDDGVYHYESYVDTSALPSWMKFDPATRVFSGTVPAEHAQLTFHVRVQAYDGRKYSEFGDTLGTNGYAGDSDFAVHLAPFVNTPPSYTAGSLPSRAAVEGQAVDFVLPAGAFHEPDGDRLSYSAFVQEPGHYEWQQTRFGAEPEWEQVWVEGAWVALSTIGLSIDAVFGRITGTPTNLQQGVNNVRIYAHDPHGASAYGDFALSVNRKPSGPTSLSHTVSVNQAFSYTVTGFNDPEGGALSYSARLSSGAALPTWMSLSTAGVLTGRPPAPATHTIIVTATDTAGLATSTTLTLTASNDPVRYNGGLVNHTPAPGTAFSYTVPSTAFTDPNGDAITYSADANGAALPSWLAFNPTTRTFSGVPRAAGSWTIRVLAADASGVAAAGTFVITVPNHPPVNAVALPNRSAANGSYVSWPLPAGAFTDPNAESLSYHAYAEIPAHWRLVWNAQDAAYDSEHVPAKWVAVSNAGLSIDGTTGTLTGHIRPLSADSEVFYSYRVLVRASDSTGAYADGVFSAKANVPPQPPASPTLSAKQNLAYSYALQPFTDANGDPLTYTLSSLPAGLGFDPSTRVISGTPTGSGSFTITYSARDSSGAVGTTTVTLNIQANSAPVAPAMPNQSTVVGYAWSYQVPIFNDPNYDAIAYSASGLPAGLSFTPGNRVISGTPSATGTYSVYITANDGRGGVTTASFVLSVVAPAPTNQAPTVANPLVDQATISGDDFWYQFAANTFHDANGDALTYTAMQDNGSALPAWLTFDSASRTFHGTPFGTVTNTLYIRVTAKDSAGATVSDVFKLTKYGSGGGGGGGGTYIESVGDEPSQPGTSNRSDKGAERSAGRAQGQKQDDGSIATASYVTDVDSTDGSTTSTSTTTSTATVPYQTQEYWYSYDAENRILVNNGKLVDGSIRFSGGVRDSYEVRYDAVGQAVVRFTATGLNDSVVQSHRTHYDLRGQKTYEFYPETVGSAHAGGGLARRYTYDSAGRVDEVHSYFAKGTLRELDYNADLQRAPYADIGGWLSEIESYEYDRDGRLVEHLTRERPNGEWWKAHFDHEGFQITPDADTNAGYLEARRSQTNRYDAAGRMFQYDYVEVNVYRHRYDTKFEGWQTYQESTVTGRVVEGSTNYRTTTNTLSYDGQGRLLSQREHTNYEGVDDRIRYYAYNGDGRVLMRSAGTIDSAGTFKQATDAYGTRDNVLTVHSAGQQHAQLREGGKLVTTDGRTVYNQQLMNLSGAGHFGAGGGKVVVQTGEDLKAIAQRIYGNSQLWYVLADANGLSDESAALIAGTSLEAPDVKVNSNDARTFKPYNPAEAIGSTTPGLPYIEPPPDHGCHRVVATLIRVIAIVIVAFVPMAAPAAAALMAGSEVVAQKYEVNVGMRQGFSWGAIAMAAMPGGGAAGSGWKAVRSAMMNAATRYVGAYAIDKALGVEGTHFSLRAMGTSMAQAGAAAGIAQLGTKAGTTVTQASGNRVTSPVFSDAPFDWKRVAMQAVLRQGSNYAIDKAINGKDAHWHTGLALVGIAGDLAQARGAQWKADRAERAVRAQMAEQMHGAVWADGNPFNDGPRAAPSDLSTEAGLRSAIDSIMAANADQPLFASGYGGRKGTTDGAPDIMSTDGTGMHSASNHTRIASDEELYRSQADIDALRAQGRDMTAAQKALDELWTRRFELSTRHHASGDIATLETVTVSASEQVDEMGQPLHGRSDYNAFEKFGEIWGASEGVGTKLAQTWRWANYTVPDREQRRIEREARENQYWRVDQMRQSPLGSMAYVAGHLSGASQQTQDALLRTGSLADAMMPGGARRPIRPASVRVRPGQPLVANKGATTSADAPYVHRYDPAFPGRPDPKFSVDSTTFSNPIRYNANGFPRDAGQFWKQWAAQNPGSLSTGNRYLVDNYSRLKVSPRVDDTWIKTFPEHGNYFGDVLVHHHVNFGRYTIPVPGKTHVGSGGPWHY
jgi:YD repeat-containing protein